MRYMLEVYDARQGTWGRSLTPIGQKEWDTVGAMRDAIQAAVRAEDALADGLKYRIVSTTFEVKRRSVQIIDD